MRVLFTALAFSVASFVVGVVGDLSDPAQAEPARGAVTAYAALPPLLATPVAVAAPAEAQPMERVRIAELAEAPGKPFAVKIGGKAPPTRAK